MRLPFHPDARHQHADLATVGAARRARRRKSPGADHHQPVGYFIEFVEVLAHHQHGRAARRQIDDGLADGGGRTGVDSPRRLTDDLAAVPIDDKVQIPGNFGRDLS